MATTSEQLNELAAALVLAQAEFETVSKDSTNPFFKSKYAGLPEVMKTAGPVLAKHGLAVSQFLGCDDQGDTLTTWLIHKSGQYINDTMRLHLTKDDPQGQGSATTYARRYSYMAVLGLVADEDDDGNAGSRHKPAQARQKTPHEQFPDSMRAVLNDEPPQTLSSEQVAELLALAKKKGYLDKKAAVDFLNVQAMGDFTKLPAEQFDSFKKLVIAAGWKS